jgi:hypothetical protein
MPGSRTNSLKDPKLYEDLRQQGDSKEKAARISNAVARDGSRAVGERGGLAGSYDDWTVAKLRSRAKELGLRGYWRKTKSELIAQLRHG